MPAAPTAGVPADLADGVRGLVSFALERLPSMQLADGTFRAPAKPGAREDQGRYASRQTAIVLLGLLRAEQYGIDHDFHTGGMRGRLLGDAEQGRLGPGDLGLLLWAESRLEGDAVDELVGLLAEAMGMDGPGGTGGSALAWILIALAETSARGLLGEAGAALAEEARSELLARRRPETGLFYGPGHGPGRRFQGFESQIQIVAALAQLARLDGDSEARDAALAAAEALIGIQREDGSWPAVIDVRRAAMVEPYPLTSANQAALAPLGMHGATEAGADPSYRAAALRGLPWIWGQNELGEPMFDPDNGVFARAITRRDGVDRAHLLARAATSLLKPPAEHEARHTLRIDRATNPADLGWILEAWAGKEHLASTRTS